MLRTVQSQEASLHQGVTGIRTQTDLWHNLPETWIELEESMQKEEIHNSYEMSKDDWKYLSSGLIEAQDFKVS